MTSPPPTPNPEDGRRLQSVGTPCEWPERYRPGGYHPVELGDKFKNGTYTVIRKLGYGGFSTVWLAVDSPNKQYVALKIMIAKESSTDTELEIIQFLFQKSNTDPRSEHIVPLLDTFMREGPNGIHRCLVFEAMGPSATMMLDELPENKPRSYGRRRPRYPKWMAKTMLAHMLRGLAFLHENGIIHGDVQPGNILFAIKDISNVEESKLRQDESLPRSSTPLYRLDGKIDKWAPKNLYLEQSLYNYVPQNPDLLKVKLSDLGRAFRPNDPPSKPAMPVALRAPELILGKPLSTAIDIWAFGCLMFEFLTARPLFAATTFGWDEQQRNDADDSQFIQFYKVIGKLPDSIIDAWPRSSKFFDPVSGERINPRPQEADDYHSDDMSFQLFGNNYAPLEVRFGKDKHETINDEESAVVCSIIRQILSYSPEDRPSAADLLKHPWFALK
ncbi:hypothetical protein Clacol_009617 [Clathrus columnatus]|uniref:non-specific serine/threonine protein kinase n=1 Tax=Clathrus columnatus TaxID=1419009 RepID=A0AAV5AR34_9AGAM|nr:hypothetical protein Clacol_009617 [Clathrus columnatus]